MPRIPTILVLGLALAWAGAAGAKLYECRDANGKLSFQDTPCASGEESKERLLRSEAKSRAPSAGKEPPLVVLDGPPPTAPVPVAAGERYALDAAFVATSEEWTHALAKARRNHTSGTLLRVFLENPTRVDTIQAAGTKLSDPGSRGGGGRFRELPSGGFLFVERVQGSAMGGRTPVEFASLSHGMTRIQVPLPEGEVVAAGGDLVLARVPGAQMGEIVLSLPAEVGAQRVVVAPLVVGGPYGESFSCAAAKPCRIGPIAPANYKLLFPDLDVRKSRFVTSVAARERTTVSFLPGGEKALTPDRESHQPLPGAPAPR